MVKAIEGYKPHKAKKEILDCAMAHIQTVPYEVTLRWLFYRLLQDGKYRKKEDYAYFKRLVSVARKSFYDGWSPYTLVDDTRDLVEQGDGWQSVAHWIEAVKNAEYEEVVWNRQRYYIEVWFEADAMVRQFKWYVKDISLLAFHGDCSIAAKWTAAKRLEDAHIRHGLPIVIIYFGDDDAKGREIPENAINDVKAWCNIPFEFVRGGLKPGDGARLGIPENFEKPGTYQWEALDDPEARQLITESLAQYFDFDKAREMHLRAKTTTKEYQDRMKQYFEDWQ